MRKTNSQMRMKGAFTNENGKYDNLKLKSKEDEP
jgi:hypothetical protein